MFHLSDREHAITQDTNNDTNSNTNTNTNTNTKNITTSESYDDMKKAIHFEVFGRVQGVYFRVSAQDKAKSLGLTGWVQNNPDGFVEGVACGTPEALELFCVWVKNGPEMAQVSQVNIEEEPTGLWSTFEIN